MSEPTATDEEIPVDFQTDPSRYRHWKLDVDGSIATLTLDVDEGGGLRGGYRLKLNSYDLGVDIELHDALQRVRFIDKYRSYVINYNLGKDLVRAHVEALAPAGDVAKRWQVFGELLSSPRLPSGLKQPG